jgi:flagellar hook-associated protein 3 FlgL
MTLNSIGEQFLANLNILQSNMSTTNSQLSSGYRISKPSDDPAAITDVLQLEFDGSRVSQTISNLNTIQGSVNTAEGALQSASSLLDQAQTLAVQGATSTQTAAERTTLGNQVSQILSQLVGISNTTFEGRYVFSGDAAQSPAYKLDSSSPTGVDQLQSAPSTQLAEDSNGVTFAVGLTASEIFDDKDAAGDPTSNNVFAALNSLSVALNNNDQSGITAALGNLNSAQSFFEGQQAFYGSVQDRITNSLTSAQQNQTQWAASLSQLRDTDVAAAATQLSEDNLSQQAALQAEASLPHTSLFDFIK